MRPALLLLSLAAACTGSDRLSLAELGPVAMRVDVNVGKPVRPQSGDAEPQQLFVNLDHDLAGCPSLAFDIEASLDDTPPTNFEPGTMESGSNHGKDESFCVEPVVYFEHLPAARPRSTIRISDDTVSLSLDVDRLLVNPPITVATPLRPGAMATLVVNDPRPIASAVVWWRDAVADAQRVEWEFAADVATPGEIRFAVPAGTRSAGTLGVEITITDHQMTCSGFASCEVFLRGGASFPLTTAR